MYSIKENLFRGLIISLLVHLCLVFFLPSKIFHFGPKKNRKAIEVSVIKRPNKFRNVGKKNGSKLNNIIVKTNPTPFNQRSFSYAKTKTSSKNLTLDKIRTSKSATLKIPPQQINKKIKLPKLENTDQENAINFSVEKIDLKNKFRQAVVSPEEAYFLNKTGLDIHFETPEGVDINDLNKQELVFYSFKKRIGETFVNSVLSSYQKYKLSNPHHLIPAPNLAEQVTGRITYDRQGNVKVIKVLKWSTDDNTQEFFEQALQNIKNLPNPPKDILRNKTNDFDVYYTIVFR